MRSTFSGLSIAISGLYVNKKALDTTSHNIANVNNPSYVRQQVIQSTSGYFNLPGGFQIGSGVTIQQIRQIRDEFLDLKYRLESGRHGYWAARNMVFEQVQGILNELSNSGLQKVMDQFWNGWEELSKNPDNLTVRGLLKERAIAFIETVNHLGQQIDNLQINLNKEIQIKVKEINDIAKRIAKLNENILVYEVKGYKGNDYRDDRNALLDRLSELVNIEYKEEANGVVNVSIGGKMLVNGKFYTEMETRQNGSAFVDIFWKDISEKVNIEDGELLGLIHSRGDVQKTILAEGNGTVNKEVDVVIAVDITSSNMNDINNMINKYKDDLKNRGLEPRFKLVTFGDGSVKDITKGFVEADKFTASLSQAAEVGNEDLSSLISEIESMNDFRANAHKKLIIITDENIGGNSNVISDNEITNYVDRLNRLDIFATVISDSTYQYTGDIGEDGWDGITDGTSDKFFSIKDITRDDFAEKLSQETTNTASKFMGSVKNFLEIIPSIKKKLNAFVNTIARNVNYIHKKGKTLLGTSGENFFVAINPDRPIEVGNITLNSNLDTLNNIAVSQSGDRGDGRIAEKIAQLRNEYLFADMNSDDYYRDIISSIGVAANEAAVMEQSQKILVSQIDDKRKSISAVSLDEEMTDMLKYQHSYVASSRVVNAIDEMIDNIINRMGVVGR
ncbi:flagellar hook-associated protein 1 FlgK [Caloranaerobacter azorensis DSM 13643]|uniref:Flagellar hook-associated protein 1 n=1 Tax=Caloranaerobacter azorensis DSM 13643 TaxID=1121264 RepID=A0A1M5V450_9FIRM|nr:flagellar hook-associated protein FlgK [Caloranaerobacter azorensis]SHH69898.1 flagellar hook-associated protein 1 FlgK [Caloranaerobacter azorensis DSM 13643]